MESIATVSTLTLFALGAFHGVNPGMGWLFAVARGMQERRRAEVWRALLPLGLGHALAVSAAIAVALALGEALPVQALRSITMVRRAAYALSGGNARAAGRLLDIAEQIVETQGAATMPEETAEELGLMIYRLRRNVQLVEWNLLPGDLLM